MTRKPNTPTEMRAETSTKAKSPTKLGSARQSAKDKEKENKEKARQVYIKKYITKCICRQTIFLRINFSFSKKIHIEIIICSPFDDV
jgi:hypothetical protein